LKDFIDKYLKYGNDYYRLLYLLNIININNDLFGDTYRRPVYNEIELYNYTKDTYEKYSKLSTDR